MALTYSTEFIIWARKSKKTAHKFNYELMKRINDNKQMTDVWRLPAIGRWEKTCGKHPTQKPLSLLTRIILSCTEKGDWILDPFSGSSTTGIAANLCGRKFCGLEQEKDFFDISVARRKELDDPAIYKSLRKHLSDLLVAESSENEMVMACEEEGLAYGMLPFDTKSMAEV